MKAILLNAKGGPEALSLSDIPTPTGLPSGYLRVRVKAAGINPVDTKMRAKADLYPLVMPTVLGCDGAGIVEAVGADVPDFQVGDEIYYCQAPWNRSLGQYAEMALVDHRVAARKPRSLNFIQAAAAPLALITAWEGLHDRAGVKPGSRVLIHAGAGGVGHLAIQIARHAGASVAVTVGSRRKARVAEDLGASASILYKEQDFVAAALHWSQGQGVDIALDTVGGETFTKSFAAVRVYGDLVTLLQPPGSTDWTVARNRNLRISFELMLSPWFMQLDRALRRQGEILREAAQLFDGKQLAVHVDETFPLARASDAHRKLAGGTVMGKLVLEIG